MGTFEEYASALAEAKVCQDVLDRTMHNLRTVADALEKRRARFSFTNTGVSFPLEAVLTNSATSFDGDGWKSAKAINEDLVKWHEARSKVKSIWNQLPPDQRAALVAPPKYILNDYY